MPPQNQDLYNNLISGNRQALAKAITLVESTKESDQEDAEDLLDHCLKHSGNSVRIGITGVPGVGKSTFIEAFGKHLINDCGKKVAVLAVDPTSIKTRGSILGDKTRMAELSAMENAFIRPSPSSGALGGVGLASREIIILCEAAGFDAIIIETVGVGQSETDVRQIVDFFILLMLPGAGDELQGIKRGIIELADAIFINKSDGDNIPKAKLAKAAYESALHLFPPADSGWTTPVEVCSSLDNKNIDLAWKLIGDYLTAAKKSGYFESLRREQLLNWFHGAAEKRMLSTFHGLPQFEKLYAEYEKISLSEKVNPRKASRLFVDKLMAQRLK